MKKILYHGSTSIIDKPIFGYGKSYNDYGVGFYCTEYIELAKEWACNENTCGFANVYEIDINDLKILDLSLKEYNVLNWLAILLDNRIVNLSTPIQKAGKDYLINHFLPDYKQYDIIKGYRADDAYFLFARAFINNEISLKQLGYAMKLGKLGEQYCIKSEKAFSKLIFKGFEVADNNVYYAKRIERNDKAKDEYIKELENDDIDGIYIRDLIKGGYINGDKRLQF